MHQRWQQIGLLVLGLGLFLGISSNAASTPGAQGESAKLKAEAVSAAKAVAQAYPANPLTFALLGAACYNSGRSDEATQHLTACLKLRPDLLEAHEMLARIAYERGAPDEAIRLAEEGIRRCGPSPDLLKHLGHSQLDLGRTDDAIATLEQIAGGPAPMIESLYLLGQAHMQARDYDRARKRFQEVIKAQPDHTQAYFGLFTACQRSGRSAEAEQYQATFMRLEAADRKDLSDRSGEESTLSGVATVRQTVARTLFGAAQIYQGQGEMAKAGDLFLRAASLDRDSFVFQSSLEASFIRRNQVESGLEVFRRLTEEDPDNALPLLFLGRLETRIKRYDEAEKHYLEVIEIAPEWAQGYRALVEMYLGRRIKLKEAYQLAGKMVKLEPSGHHFYLLALSALRNRDGATALEAARRASLLAPKMNNYRKLYEQLQAQAGGGKPKK